MLRISVVTVTLNAEATISCCLDSILGQQGVDLQLIVKDGGSRDRTLEKLEGYGSAIHQLVTSPDQGLYDGMNQGVALATGEVVGFLNADDYYPAENVLIRVAKLFEDRDVDACYGDLRYVAANDTSHVSRYWRAGDYKSQKFYWGWMPPHPTFFVRRQAFERYGLFNLSLGSAADYELMLRFLLKEGLRVVYLPDVLVHMRTGGVSNASLANRLRANRMDRKAWEVNGLRPYPWTLWAKPLRKVGQWIWK